MYHQQARTPSKTCKIWGQCETLFENCCVDCGDLSELVVDRDQLVEVSINKNDRLVGRDDHGCFCCECVLDPNAWEMAAISVGNDAWSMPHIKVPESLGTCSHLSAKRHDHVAFQRPILQCIGVLLQTSSFLCHVSSQDTSHHHILHKHREEVLFHG